MQMELRPLSGPEDRKEPRSRFRARGRGWCHGLASNQQPSRYEGDALPLELPRHAALRLSVLEPQAWFEQATGRLQIGCSSS